MKKYLDNSKELNYCHNCGGEPILDTTLAKIPDLQSTNNKIINLNSYRKTYYVICNDCGLSTANCDSAEQAIEQWNSETDLS